MFAALRRSAILASPGQETSLFRRIGAKEILLMTGGKELHTSVPRMMAVSSTVISQEALDRIRDIERIILEDPGNRGIGKLFVDKDFEKAVLSLAKAKSTAVITGFPCNRDFEMPYENDGVSGTVAVTRALTALQKDVTIVVDTLFVQMMRTIISSCVSAGILPKSVPVLDWDNANASRDRLQSCAREFLFPGHLSGLPRFDVLLAIERSGPASSGHYCTMNGVLVDDLLDPLDTLFDCAYSSRPEQRIVTIGIGDGGNEIGMGKVMQRVKEHIPKGEIIACKTCTDYLVTAGVSDWGGFALAAGVYYATRGEDTAVEKDAVLLTVDQAEELLGILGGYGLLCGVTKKSCNFLDGMPFRPVHADLLGRIRGSDLEQR